MNGILLRFASPSPVAHTPRTIPIPSATTAFFAVALVAAGVAGGCATATRQRERAHVALGSAACDLDRPSAAVGSGDATASTLTFEEACLRLALQDDSILASLARVRELDVDVAQSRSIIWPRAELRTFAEIAPGTGDARWIGGAYLQYNLSRALFASDEIAVAKARKAKAYEELRLQLRETTRRLQARLTDLGLLDQEVASRQRMVEAADQTARLAETSAEAGRGRLADVWRARVEAASQAALLGDARRRAASERRALALALGRGMGEPPTIRDAAELLRPAAEPLAPAPAPSELWSRRAEAHIAEIDLFLAQMGRTAARRERLPRPLANVGWGNIPLSSRLTEATWVVRLGVEMPLIDFGDISRKIRKSEINVDLARRHALAVVTRVVQQAELTRIDLEQATVQARAASDLVAEMRRADEAGPALLEQYRADTIDVLTQRLRLGETEVRAQQAQGALVKAAAAHRLALGEALAPELEERLIEALLRQKEPVR